MSGTTTVRSSCISYSDAVRGVTKRGMESSDGVVAKPCHEPIMCIDPYLKLGKHTSGNPFELVMKSRVAGTRVVPSGFPTKHPGSRVEVPALPVYSTFATPVDKKSIEFASPPRVARSYTIDALNELTHHDRNRYIGEKLLLLIQSIVHPKDNAGKITGMLLELDNSELVDILNDENILRAKVEEAITVLLFNNMMRS